MSPLPGIILVVDDHAALAENLAEILADAGYQTAWTDSAESALQTIERGGVAALITDYRLPGLNGAQLIAEIRKRGIGIPAVVMSAHTDLETIGFAESAGALRVLPKPVDRRQLLDVGPRMDKPLDVSRLLDWVANAVAHGQTSRPGR